MARFSPRSPSSLSGLDEIVDIPDVPPASPTVNVVDPPAPGLKFRRLVEFWKARGLLMFVVVLPTVLSTVSFGLLASDVYVSESRFVVRSPERPSSAMGLTALLQGVGFGRANDDSFSIQDFILSRDALRKLDEVLKLRAIFSDTSIDRLSRFPRLDMDDSFEALHRFYQKQVGIQHDSATSISTLTVRAFNAEQALQINKQLLEMSEGVVNRMNDRARTDLIKYARNEVNLAEAKVKAATGALTAYRTKQSVVDPDKEAALQMQQISRLQDELSATTVQLSQLRVLTPDNPQIPALVSKEKSLSSQIASESAKMTGGNGALANKSGEFLRYSLDVEFAGKQLSSALASLEAARNDAQRQQVYLERIAEPSLADMAQEPKRIRNIFFTLLMGLVAWGVLTMLWAGVREHQD